MGSSPKRPAEVSAGRFSFVNLVLVLVLVLEKTQTRTCGFEDENEDDLNGYRRTTESRCAHAGSGFG